MRGLIQIEILCELERMTDKRITELFDVIMGTSTGGILALGLVYKKMSLAHLRQLFIRLKDEIFSKSSIGGYNTKALEELLKKELGCDMKMSDITYPKYVSCIRIIINVHVGMFSWSYHSLSVMTFLFAFCFSRVFVAAVNKSHLPLKLQWFNNCLGDEYSRCKLCTPLKKRKHK